MISVKTAENHRARLMEKRQAVNSVMLVRHAVHKGLFFKPGRLASPRESPVTR